MSLTIKRSVHVKEPCFLEMLKHFSSSQEVEILSLIM